MFLKNSKKSQENTVDTSNPEVVSKANEMEQLGQATINGIKEADNNAAKKIDEEFLAEMRLQEQEMKKIVPDFDLATEIEKNPMFAVMLSFKEPMGKVFEYFNPDFLYSEIERDILERIQARNLRPLPVEQRGKNGGFNVNNLSRKDMEEIDKRVRRGERIEF